MKAEKTRQESGKARRAETTSKQQKRKKEKQQRRYNRDGKTRKQTQIGRTGRLGRPTCPGAGNVLCTIVFQYRKLTRQESREEKTR